MKKLFVMLTMSSFLTACNNGSEGTANTAADSLKATESPLTDAVNIADSASKIIKDSTLKITDSIMK